MPTEPNDDAPKDRPRNKAGQYEPELSPADLDRIVDLIREGNRQLAVAKRYGVSGKALTNRKARDHAFRERMRAAEFEGERDTLQALEEASEKGEKVKADVAMWKLRHRYAWQTSAEQAKIEALRAGVRASQDGGASLVRDVALVGAMLATVPGFAHGPITPRVAVAPPPKTDDADGDEEA